LSVLAIHHLVADRAFVSANDNRAAVRIVEGSEHDTEYNVLFRLTDGRIAEVWEVADTAKAFGP
jgi:hypothetical protein